MDQINEFVDERQNSWCIQCGAWIEEVDTNRDHVPSKVFLRKPYPENLPVVVTCVACNNGFSPDEEYLHLLLHCVLTGSTVVRYSVFDRSILMRSFSCRCNARAILASGCCSGSLAARRVASGSPKR